MASPAKSSQSIIRAMGTVTPKDSRTRDSTIVACSESPPRSMKLSSRPTQSRFNTPGPYFRQCLLRGRGAGYGVPV